MTPEQYRTEALRTEYTPRIYVQHIYRSPGGGVEPINARLLHAFIGVATETGELGDWIKKDLIYGKPVERVRILEELGDKAWYINLGLDAIGATWSECFNANIAKLRARYPEKFTQERALNRNDAAEYAALITGTTQMEERINAEYARALNPLAGESACENEGDFNVYDLAEKMAAGQQLSTMAQKEVAAELIRVRGLLRNAGVSEL